MREQLKKTQRVFILILICFLLAGTFCEQQAKAEETTTGSDSSDVDAEAKQVKGFFSDLVHSLGLDDAESADSSIEDSTESVIDSDSDDDQPFYSGPGWNLINEVWRYGDAEGLQIYASNTLYQAWSKISDRASESEYYIVVDCSANELYIFYGSQNDWIPLKYWQCSTGYWTTPTKKGDFTVLSKGYSFGEPKYSCYYYTEFSTNYLFHSILYKAGTFDIKDDRLGMNISGGCVRLDIDNAKWIYDNVPIGTAVYIY